MVGKITDKEKKMFRTLLIMDTVRGEHSTGVSIVTNAGAVSTYKQVGNPYELFDSMRYNTAINGNCAALIGHNRYATKGAVNKTNAHPFTHGDITGCHNGTLTKQHLLPDSTKFNVDSENIMYAIDKNGAEATIKKLCGAYALTWYDQAEDKVNLVRNKERPLCMSYAKDRKTIFWASEAWMLQVAAAKAGLEIGEVFTVKTGRLISIPVPSEYPAAVKEFSVDTITHKEVQEYVEPVVKKSETSSTSSTKELPFKVEDGVEVQKHCSKTVIFRIRGFRSTGNTEYMWGTISGTNIEVRLHTTHKSKRGAEWYDVTKLWKGYVKKVHLSPGTPYGVIDLRTIKESHIQQASSNGSSDMDKLDHVGFNGQLFTGKEMSKKLEIGCAWCSEVPNLDETDEVWWVGYREYLCPCRS